MIAMYFSRFLSSLIVLLSTELCVVASPGQEEVLGPESNKGLFDTIRDSLIKASIINEVVDDFAPKCFVSPHYGNMSVTLGNILKPTKTKKMPGLDIYCKNLGSMSGLTIALTDPDAPSRLDPRWSEMCHWIAKLPVAFHENELQLSLDDDGFDELVEYKPPGPPPKTGFHRYVFLLLEGDNSNLTAPEERQHWGTGKERHGVRDWAGDEGLEVIGANFFYARNKKQ